MRKIFTFLALVVMSASAFAQWVLPQPTPTSMVDDGETDLYLYNTGAHGFFIGANDYMTRASVSFTEGAKIRMTQVFEDEEKTVPTGTWAIVDYVAKFSEYRKTFADNAQSIWVDNNAGANCDEWVISLNDGNYTIVNKGVNAEWTLGVSEIYNGEKGNTRLWLHDTSLTYEKEVDGEKVEEPCFGGEFWDKWIFITEEEYTAFLPKIAAYNSAVRLKASLDAAKEEYAGKVDFSSVEAVYNNTSSTAEQLQEAEDNIATLITEYKSSLATFDKPLDMTDLIGDGTNSTPWAQDFTGEGKVGEKATNTWSVEANNGADGTDMVTPFSQVWVGSGGKLSDQKIHQTIKGCAPGLYLFKANVRAYSEAGGIDKFEGLSMYFGKESTNPQEQVEMFKSGNKCVLWKKGGFSIIAIVKEMGDIDLGFDIKDANFNWISFKETSLTFYGNKDVEENAVKLLKSDYAFESAEGFDAKPELISAYQSALAAFEAAAITEDIKSTAKEANSAYTALKANADAYAKLLSKIEIWENAIGDHEDLAGEYWDNFSDFVQTEEEIEDYPTPNPILIKEGDRSLDTPEIEAYISKVDSLYAFAVANSLSEGSDCTDMLINPSFAEGFTGWTKADGKSTPTGNVGGLASCKDVEVYENVVYVQQVVNNVPDGIYSLSCQAFERPAGNGNYDGSEEPKVFLFMNDFQTPVQNICKDAVPEGSVVNLTNCYVAADAEATEGTGAWPYDYNVANYGWVPNSMDGASYAFAAGRYVQKVYGLVNGGKMTIGLTSNGVKAHWVLWANFKLTFEGKSAEALAEILPSYTEELSKYLEDNSDNITTPVSEAIEKVLILADEAIGSGDGDQMFAALETLNETLAAAKANVAANTAFTEVYETAATTYEESTNEKAKAEYDKIADEIANYTDFTTEQLVSYTEQLTTIAKDLKIPGGTASDDSPLNYTAYIENADIEQGAGVAWKYTKNGGNGPALASGINGASIEFWNGTAANLAFNIYQAITLPAGKYELKATASNSYNGQEPGTGEGHAYMYATVAGTNKTSSTQVVEQESGCTESYNTYSVIFTVPEGGSEVTVGFQSVGTMSARWFVCDDFELVYYGTESSKGDTEDSGAVEVTSIASVNAAPSAIYSVAGTRSNKLQKGINIVKMSNGKVQKVLVK